MFHVERCRDPAGSPRSPDRRKHAGCSTPYELGFQGRLHPRVTGRLDLFYYVVEDFIDFQVLAVNVDRDPADARTFLSRRPVGYPSAFDPQGELPGRFGVQTMPTSFLIDRQGVVRLVHEGFRKGDVDALRDHIQELVASGR